MARLQVVVPYPESNASVRSRATHWIQRYAAEHSLDFDAVATVVGLGCRNKLAGDGVPVLMLRNRHRFSRGRAESHILRAADPGIYDLDDGLPWDDGRLPELGRWWKRPWPRSLIADRCAREADRMIVGNDTLADWASSRCGDVRVIPTCVEPGDYEKKASYAIGARPVIGWIGSPATEPYLEAVAPALAEMNRRHGMLFEIISGPGVVSKQLAPFTTRVAWSLDVAHARLAKWDVGIMPLADGVYERAKCGYKLLQYAAAGLPAVGTPVGVNRTFLSDMNASAPTSPSEWVDALDELLTEAATRRALRGDAGRRLAERYSYSAWEAAWRSAACLE